MFTYLLAWLISQSEHRFPAPLEGCRKPVLGVRVDIRWRLLHVKIPAVIKFRDVAGREAGRGRVGGREGRRGRGDRGDGGRGVEAGRERGWGWVEGGS